MTPTTGELNPSPTFTTGVAARVSSRMIRSGLKSVGRTRTPPRTLSTPASWLWSPTTGISPKPLRGPTTTAWFTWTRIPSRLS